MSEFDEEWEQLLYRICASDYYLQHKALNISQLLNSMRITIKKHLNPQTKENEGEPYNETPEQIEENIRSAMRMSAITNLEANDAAPVNYHTSSFLKEVRDRLIVSLKKTLSQYFAFIAPNSTRVQENAPIRIMPKVELNLFTQPDKGKIRLDLQMVIFGHCKNTQYESVEQYIEQHQLSEQFKAINEDYEKTVRKFSQQRTECFESRSMMQGAYTYCHDHFMRLQFGILFPTIEEFMGEQVIADMTEMVCAMLTARQRMDEMLGNN